MTGRAIGTRLALAQARADAARARLSDTLGTLQHRASPQVFAHDVAETLKERGRDAVLQLADTAKRRPARFGIALVIVGLFLSRRQITRLLWRKPGSTTSVKIPKQGSTK